MRIINMILLLVVIAIIAGYFYRRKKNNKSIFPPDGGSSNQFSADTIRNFENDCELIFNTDSEVDQCVEQKKSAYLKK